MASNIVNKDACAPKHRACDECRSRKLACSKEPSGCERCRKEGIQCHYSPQKPMGRPRKRRHVEEEAPPPSGPSYQPALTFDASLTGYPNQLPYDSYSVDAALTQPNLSLDPSLSFLDDPDSSGLEFLDLLPNEYRNPAALPEPQILVPRDNYDIPTTIPLGVDLLENINFDEPDSTQDAVSKDLSDSLQQYMVQRCAQPSEPAESILTDSSPGSDQSLSVESPQPPSLPLRPVPTVNCGCLSSLYLALDSLTRLPSNVISAMRVARNATKTAHDVINCPVCSIPLVDDPTAPPPIQCFQNMMFLGALVPSACNAYATILEMVDAETELAKQQGRNFWFTFKDVGGLWGKLGDTPQSCSAIENYNNKSMSPDMWRLTIRALLRLDVYGLSEMKVGAPASKRYTQQGLKDVVDKLEERSRKRHDILDEMIASGQLPKSAHFGVIYPREHVSPEQRNCTKILETARVALENLVIA